MTMTRRLFSMLLPAAPAAANEVGKTVVGLAADPYPHNPTPFNTVGMLNKAVWKPANLDKYYEAERVLHRAQAFKWERNRLITDRVRIDPNIMALKSVSPQHKAMMHLMQEERAAQARRTFTDDLKKAFGLEEYFKKLQETHGDGAQASTGW